MQIAVTSKGAGLGAWLDPDFNRCAQIVIVDDKNRFQSWPNDFQPDDDGVSLAQRLVAEQVVCVVTGLISTQASFILASAGIQVLLAQRGSVLELVEAARNGKLAFAHSSSTTH